MEGTETEVGRARSDPEYRNLFLQQNKKFILASAYQALNRYITDSDDEWSVALLAFNEAIDDFEEGHGTTFEGFARIVIQRRLLNYSRSEQRFRNEYSTQPSVLEGDLDGTEAPNSFEMEVQERVGEISGDDRHRRLLDEIEALEEVMRGYGIDFFDLEKSAPKAEKTRKSCLVIVSRLRTETVLMGKLRQTKALPVRELTEGTKIHKKVLERHRKYIVTAAEIVCGDYPLLKEYIPL